MSVSKYLLRSAARIAIRLGGDVDRHASYWRVLRITGDTLVCECGKLKPERSHLCEGYRNPATWLDRIVA